MRRYDWMAPGMRDSPGRWLSSTACSAWSRARICSSSVPASGICPSVVFFFNSFLLRQQFDRQQIGDASGERIVLMEGLSSFVRRAPVDRTSAEQAVRELSESLHEL